MSVNRNVIVPACWMIAERAGVSPITVSRVINHSGYASADTRARVEAAVIELGMTMATLNTVLGTSVALGAQPATSIATRTSENAMRVPSCDQRGALQPYVTYLQPVIFYLVSTGLVAIFIMLGGLKASVERHAA